MHHGGGSAGRKNALRCAVVRQRRVAALACDTNFWVVGRISHSRAVSSKDAVTMRWPSGLKAALITIWSWPLISPIGLAVWASHSRAVLSADAVTMRLPSGLKAALSTKFAWPVSGSPIGLAVSASHSRAVSSKDAVT